MTDPTIRKTEKVNNISVKKKKGMARNTLAHAVQLRS